ncbi:MAG: NUDIX hydrolase [Bacteroidales bacterium]|nr:NUDIX hydrolase [Bacteroidales bacterium]MCL2133624.1 NUDIX hydrolase [Bacteroidales bacterium]
MRTRSLHYDKQALSVDCVVFGFNGKLLKVLLEKRRRISPSRKIISDLKLPGSLISDTEDINDAAYRVISEFTGARNISLRQMEVFSEPKRVQGNELNWINDYYRVSLTRVVTIVFFALVKLDEKLEDYSHRRGAKWVELNEVQNLALDHNKILITAIDHLLNLFHLEPVAFEFLPRKFTIRQLQNLYETIFDVKIDNRNFRKKMASLEYVVPLDKKESNVAHKPAQYYSFNKRKYEQKNRKIFKLSSVYK